MPDNTTPALDTTAAAKARRTRSALNQALIAELTLAGQIAATTEKDGYAAALADEEIDAAFITNLRAKISDAETLLGSAAGKRVDKKSTTKREEALKRTLLEKLDVIQSRAKRKYKAGDPMRAKYFIGQRIEVSRALLENSTRTLLKNLAADTLPGMKAADATALQTALDAYLAVQSDQTGDQEAATTNRAQLEAKVKEVAELRREIQYAVDTIWPATNKTNAGIRVEFQIPANRALN